MSAQVTLTQIQDEVNRMDPSLKGKGGHFRSAVLLLSALAVGTSLDDLVGFTGYRRSFVEPRVKRLQQSGVFTRDGQIAAQWFDENGGIAFWMDVCVAEGLMQRAPMAR
jgi:hypothetical protein